MLKELSDVLGSLLGQPSYRLVKEQLFPRSNALHVWRGRIEDNQLAIEYYEGYGEDSGWFHFTTVFGQVRNIWDHTPLGEFGIATATTSINHEMPADDGNGCAIPGFQYVGLGYRVGTVNPKGRTCSNDYYTRTDNILDHLLSLRSQISDGTTDPRDASYGFWPTARSGW